MKSLTEEEKYKIIRPIIGEFKEDKQHLPIISNTPIKNINWLKIEPLNFTSMNSNTANTNKIILMFAYDKILNRLWNNPLRYIPQFTTASFVTTPDYSVYETMNYNEICHNVYKNRWLGKTWQNYGCNVIPTIQWCTSATYDICFGGIEKGCPVIISTLGCHNRQKEFLTGFSEMKKRINPELIIVYGDMIQGMTGEFINYRYTDSFSCKEKFKQLSFFENHPVFEIKEVI